MDWVGRAVAEAETAVASHSITLIIGKDALGRSDHPAAAVLDYTAVQRYWKRLRKSGHAVRYLAVGEYGALKGRAHHHLLTFWQSEPPDHLIGKRFLEKHWPEGLSFYDDFSVASARYVLKYMLKTADDAERQFQMRASTRPLLGGRYFVDLAHRHVDQGLAPQDGRYRFLDIRDRRSRIIDFTLRRSALDLYLGSFVDAWARLRGGHPPSSPFLEEWQDRQARKRVDPGWRPVARPMPRPHLGNPLPYPTFVPAGAGPVSFSEPVNAYSVIVDGARLWWTIDEVGELAWRTRVTGAVEAARRRAAAVNRADPALYRRAHDPGGDP